MSFKVAVVGATGNVGREMLTILEERGFPAGEVVALASRRSLGTEAPMATGHESQSAQNYDFSDTRSPMSAGFTSRGMAAEDRAAGAW